MSLELKPSYQLQLLIEDAAKTLSNFADKWTQVKQIGNNEGFTDKDLQDMIRPYLKQHQLNKDQIYYLFNSEKQKERVSNNRNVTMNVDKKDIEELDTKPIGQKINQAVDVVDKNLELEQTNQRLRKELADQKEALAKTSVFTADKEETNFNKLFDMLPRDDKTTFKNKEAGLTVFTNLFLALRSEGVKQLQWWVRVIK